MGHAGSDVETAYRDPAELAADLDRDPLVATARLLIESGALTAAEVIARYEAMRSRVDEVATDAASRPLLASADQIMAPAEDDAPTPNPAQSIGL